METIKWGMVGCGDVAELKSGPAFQKTESSELLAVMRRNRDKAKDFAHRHGVPIWSDNAGDLLENSDINAIYIATPPATHLEYALKALDAGKHVYLEKPMTLTSMEANRIVEVVENSHAKLTVAHYRRKLPAFVKVKELLEEGAIGKVIFADIQILQPKKSNIIADTDENWRLTPEISGGGYFYDIAPHQIDLMYHYFGAFNKIEGFSTSKDNEGLVEDTVNGIIRFQNGIQFRGIWNFIASEGDTKDECVIYGEKGRISFSFYGESAALFGAHGDQVFNFKNPKHIQQPMIAAVVDYFLGAADNPCSAREGFLIMQALERLSGR